MTNEPEQPEQPGTESGSDLPGAHGEAAVFESPLEVGGEMLFVGLPLAVAVEESERAEPPADEMDESEASISADAAVASDEASPGDETIKASPLMTVEEAPPDEGTGRFDDGAPAFERDAKADPGAAVEEPTHPVCGSAASVQTAIEEAPTTKAGRDRPDYDELRIRKEELEASWEHLWREQEELQSERARLEAEKKRFAEEIAAVHAKQTDPDVEHAQLQEIHDQIREMSGSLQDLREELEAERRRNAEERDAAAAPAPVAEPAETPSLVEAGSEPQESHPVAEEEFPADEFEIEDVVDDWLLDESAETVGEAETTDELDDPDLLDSLPEECDDECGPMETASSKLREMDEADVDDLLCEGPEEFDPDLSLENDIEDDGAEPPVVSADEEFPAAVADEFEPEEEAVEFDEPLDEAIDEAFEDTSDEAFEEASDEAFEEVTGEAFEEVSDEEFDVDSDFDDVEPQSDESNLDDEDELLPEAPAAEVPEAEAPAVDLDDARNPDTIAAYMERLLGRKPKSGQPETQGSQPVGMKPAAPSGQQDEKKAARKRRPRPATDKDSIRENITSIREIANLSARQTLANYQLKRSRNGLVTMSLLAMAFGAVAVALLTSELWSDVSFVKYAWAAVAISGFAASEYYRTVGEIHKRFRGMPHDGRGLPKNPLAPLRLGIAGKVVLAFVAFGGGAAMVTSDSLGRADLVPYGWSVVALGGVLMLSILRTPREHPLPPAKPQQPSATKKQSSKKKGGKRKRRRKPANGPRPDKTRDAPAESGVKPQKPVAQAAEDAAGKE